MINSRQIFRARRVRSGFTLIELMITVSILAMMAAMILFALYSAQETAKEAKTKSIIAKLDSIIKAKWDSYKTRRVPITLAPGTGSAFAAKFRLDALHDLMRMEMPDRWQDVIDGPATINRPTSPSGNTFNVLANRPALSQGFFRRYTADSANLPPTKTANFENAECLYMVITAIAMEGEVDIDSIPSADTDGNGVPEFIDGWGNPIRWFRWAPGFVSDLQTQVSGTIASANPSGKTVTLTATGPTFSQNAGAYVGGTIGVTTSSGDIDPKRMARITGYTFSNPTATFTCSTEGTLSTNGASRSTMQQPFGLSTPPSVGDTFVVMAPDPFDPAGVYPMYSDGSASAPSPIDTSIPSFALYPLIYSTGPDKISSIFGAIGGSTPLQYKVNNNTPFVIDSSNLFVGGFHNATGITGQPWLDNIHNHTLNVK